MKLNDVRGYLGRAQLANEAQVSLSHERASWGSHQAWKEILVWFHLYLQGESTSSLRVGEFRGGTSTSVISCWDIRVILDAKAVKFWLEKHWKLEITTCEIPPFHVRNCETFVPCDERRVVAHRRLLASASRGRFLLGFFVLKNK